MSALYNRLCHRRQASSTKEDYHPIVVETEQGDVDRPTPPEEHVTPPSIYNDLNTTQQHALLDERPDLYSDVVVTINYTTWRPSDPSLVRRLRVTSPADLRPYVNLTLLNVNNEWGIPNRHIMPLIALESLVIADASNISDEGLEPLTKLRNLRLYRCFRVSDESIRSLVNLTQFVISNDPCMRNEIDVLLNGTSVLESAVEWRKAPDSFRKHYPTLTRRGLNPLIHLKHLVLDYPVDFDDDTLDPLVNLELLILYASSRVTG